jgi:hypothetical protein
MPKFLGMDKKKWLFVGVAAAAVGAYFLLSRGGSGAGQAAGPAEQPIQGGNAGGYAPGQAPPGFFDQGEQVAAGYSQQMLQDQQSLAQSFISPNSAWSWDPLTSLWRGIKGGKSGDIGKSMTDTEARNLEPKNRGPYAHGGTSFYDQYIAPILHAVSGAAGSAASGAASGYINRQTGGGTYTYTKPTHPYTREEDIANFGTQSARRRR